MSVNVNGLKSMHTALQVMLRDHTRHGTNLCALIDMLEVQLKGETVTETRKIPVDTRKGELPVDVKLTEEPGSTKPKLKSGKKIPTKRK